VRSASEKAYRPSPLLSLGGGEKKAYSVQLDCAGDGERLVAQPAAAVAVATSTDSGAKQAVAEMAL